MLLQHRSNDEYWPLAWSKRDLRAVERAEAPGVEGIMGFIRDVAPDRWQRLDPAIHLDMGSYLHHIFVESETAAAVLTCTPGDDRHSILTNPEITATREPIDRLAGTGRLINHSIVHPNAPGELDQMESLMERGKPVGWKVYTIAG